MADIVWMEREAQRTLQRLLTRLEPQLKTLKKDRQVFETRLQQQFPRLFRLLVQLYGTRYDFFYHLEVIITTAITYYDERPKDLKKLDLDREANTGWFQSEKMIGGVCYVDQFAIDLKGIKERIPYFKELGLTYLHLMPLFDVPETNNDGGYAIRDFRKVRADLGTMEELADLAKALRAEGISLVLDFVFNHTSDEHDWAKKALAGDADFEEYYYMFPDRDLPNQYEQHLREIFPEQSPGNFVFREENHKWIWSSFWYFQWDLNYSNPAVFNAMLGEMLFLANQGVEFLRLDAVAFIWKQLGTASESLPQAHWIIQAFNALTQIVCPTLLFKSEAIVHPREVADYIAWDESPVSYNPTLMALLWETLATREVQLLQHSMSRRFDIDDDCAWINYVRVHDDIGWTFADEDAGELGINGFDHRQFLNQFFIGNFEGSFAKGIPFGVNEQTKDMRISGTGASLAGLELAIEKGSNDEIDLAVARILLIHSVIMSAGGIPLLYLGDEIAMLNDYSYLDDAEKRDDSRWAHRGKFDWERAEKRDDETTAQGRMFQGLMQQIQIRKNTPVLSNHVTLFFDTGNRHVLGYVRSGKVLILANFSEREQVVDSATLGAYVDIVTAHQDLITGDAVDLQASITLPAYGYVWLMANGE